MRLLLVRGSVLACAAALAATATAQGPQTTPPPPPAPQDVPVTPSPIANGEADAQQGFGDVVVTARQRAEKLIDTPVAVTAINTEQLARYRTDTLTKVAETVPSLVIGNTAGSGGGGTIAVRGISSAATVVGFEQPVSVVIDGVPLSNGWVTASSFFDVGQVEVLKGPQALLFGKNNTAGVISIAAAAPTDVATGYVNASHEFVADESILDAALSGPIAPGLNGRLAVRLRNMEGWMRNVAGPLANPFIPGLPLPGVTDRRLGEREFDWRVSLAYAPGGAFQSSFKLLGVHRRNDGPGLGNQVVGGCLADGRPRMFAQVDPYGDCRRDDRTSAGQVNRAIAATYPGAGDGEEYGRYDAYIGSWTNTLELGAASLTGITGYVHYDSDVYGNFDGTAFAQLIQRQVNRTKSFTQELRLLTEFDGPVNVMLGGFYQDFDVDPYRQLVKIRDNVNFNPATGLYLAWDKQGYQHNKAYSAFGQVLLKPLPQLEIAGGLRWTRETKTSFLTHVYAFNPGNPNGKTITDRFVDENVSPEVTVSYHPAPDTTLYAGYRTGYKSGGFALSSTIGTASTAADFNFGSERVKGFEGGAKGLFLDRRLRAEVSVYHYRYTDLQVNSYNPVSVSFTLANAGSVRQTGVDVQFAYRVPGGLELRAAANYNRNRFGQFVGQCYGGQTAAQGCNVLPGPAQNFTGRGPARSPDWSGNAGATYNFGAFGKEAALSADAFYSDSYFGSETLAPATLQRAFWRFNAAARLTDPATGIGLGLVGRNLSNRYYLQSAQDKTGAPGEQRGTVSRGREVALEASFRF